MASNLNIQDGDMLAFEGKGVIASAIRLRTSSRVTHIGCAYWDKFGTLCVYEAREFAGVRLYPVLKYLRMNPETRIQHYALQAYEYGIDRQAVVAEAHRRWIEQIGYATLWQFVRTWGLISRPLFDYLGFEIDTDSQRDFCSEFYSHCLNAGQPGTGLEAAGMAPGDLVHLSCLDAGDYISIGELT